MDSKGNLICPGRGLARRLNVTPINFRMHYRLKKWSKDFTQVATRTGAYSYVISRTGMRKILDYYSKNKIFLPYDLEFHAFEGMNFFIVNEDVVGHLKGALSDNGWKYYERK